jgi:hypothetical protein
MMSPPLPEMLKVPGAGEHLIGFAAVASVQSTTLVSPVKQSSRIVASPCDRATRPAHIPRVDGDARVAQKAGRINVHPRAGFFATEMFMLAGREEECRQD